jgi:hypothetical protein
MSLRLRLLAILERISCRSRGCVGNVLDIKDEERDKHNEVTRRCNAVEKEMRDEECHRDVCPSRNE